MQRVISYITFLENTLQVLCELLCLSPLPSWTLLTSAFKQFLTGRVLCFMPNCGVDCFIACFMLNSALYTVLYVEHCAIYCVLC